MVKRILYRSIATYHQSMIGKEEKTGNEINRNLEWKNEFHWNRR